MGSEWLSAVGKGVHLLWLEGGLGGILGLGDPLLFGRGTRDARFAGTPWAGRGPAGEDGVWDVLTASPSKRCWDR